MHELVTLEQMEGVIWAVMLAAAPLGLLGGALWAAVSRRRQRLWQGLFLGLVGSGVGLLWELYRWTVRIDPVREYVGLYRPAVLAADVALFVVIGVALGLAWRKAFPPTR